ncbi:MAG: MASE1 domain-containing protein, partial [Planctomycetota bacterium]
MPPKVPAPWSLALRLATLAAALAVAAHAAGFDDGCLLQAQVWLPSGVATAGVLLLGWRAVPVVFATNALLRLMWSPNLTLALANGLGSSAEAMLGAWLMHLFGAARGVASLRSLLGLYLAAAVAPVASVLIGWSFRLTGQAGDTPFVDTAPGWWRMNAIGILLVLPLTQAWQRNPDTRLRRTPEILGAIATIVLIIAALLAFTTPSIPAVLLLGSVVFVVLGAALRTGEFGGSIAALAASIAIATPTGYGIGPLTCVPLEQRHVAAQLLLGSIAATLPLFLALLSERDTNSARWLQTRELGRALLQLLPDTTYRVAADGTILDRAVTDGVTPDIESHLSGAAGTTLGEALRGELRRALASGAGEPFEFVAETAQGPREFEARFVPLPNAEALAIVRDISVRRRAEQLVRLQARILQMIATGQRRQDILLALVEGLETLIPDGRCSVLLRHGQRLFVACSPSMPDNYNALIDGLEIGAFQGACGTAAATNDNVICADLQTDPNWAAYRDLARRFGINACWSVPARSARGEVVGTFAVYHDVPRHPTPFEIEAVERAAMLAGLAIERERREALLRSTWQNVREGLFRSIPGEGFTYVNTAFARMFGYTDEQHLLHEWRNGAPRHRDCLLLLVEETLSISEREVSMVRRDGTEFWAKVTTRISFEDGDAELICDGTVVDISANRELQEQLRHSQKMEAVGLLTGGVAHDFNNLLTAITVSADALLSQLPDDTPARRDAEHVLAAARRAADLTRRLLAFGRRQPPTTEVSDLARIVDDVASLLRRLLGSGV